MLWTALAAVATVVPTATPMQVVRFDGNRELTTSDLQAAVKRVGQALTDDDDGPERLAFAVTAIYFDHGYVTARVDEPVRARDGALEVHVSEGPRFYVRAVSFSGAWPRAAAAVRATMSTRAGDAFSRALVIADVARLASTTPRAITPLTRVDLEHHTVDLELALEPASARE